MPDLTALFELDENALELFIRSSVIYLGLVAVLRIFGRREIGSLELPDLLMIVLVADGVQNGMVGDYTSITGAAIVAGTLIGWNYFLAWLAYVSPLAREIITPKPLPLIQNGQILRKNMRREMVTRDELESLLRAQGVEHTRDVKEACLEPDGELSVIKKDGNSHAPPKAKRDR